MQAGEGKEMRPRGKLGQNIKSIFCSTKMFRFYPVGTVFSQIALGVYREETDPRKGKGPAGR